MKNKIWLFLIVLLTISIAHAHQPRITPENSLENPVIIEEPEISKAYYAELTGEPHFYLINAEEPFSLYLNLLAPDLPGSRTDFGVEVTRENEIFLTLGEGEWTKYYEEYAKDDYLRGPEVEQEVPAGVYYLKVSNPDNQGKYALAVGTLEDFPLSEIINTFVLLPKIKKFFFNKSPWGALLNSFTMYLLLLLILALIVAIYAIKKFKTAPKTRRRRARKLK